MKGRYLIIETLPQCPGIDDEYESGHGRDRILTRYHEEIGWTQIRYLHAVHLMMLFRTPGQDGEDACHSAASRIISNLSRENI